ncbi:sigma-70 family RNA polymerase sigma factor [Patiriisocius hiemis]|uniref:Sigma-70 family RNA polymerase sigma factor n=1 Tax=Patiriisocius hiemis TaxID=3075604 RepID=A0ABU2YAF4_9FLAO|nr:sigma-70 family RNA polymerase sigma factor [Constantimarinum sp. W242]MDT0554609.1 sigma-70 family RNA polymerase sigma factor [Constantimarinum sp. W242]
MQQEELFIVTIKENEGIIYKVSRMYTDTEEDQKDLFQDIVYQLWKSFNSFKGNAKRSTWMYRVALNTAIAYLNRSKKQIKQTSLDFSLQIAEEEIDTSFQEKVDVLYIQIKQFSVVERGIILLYLEGRSYEEIAAITGFTETNVGTRLNRIKQKLKKTIKS